MIEVGYVVCGIVRMVKRFLHFLHRYICDISFLSFRVPDFMICRDFEQCGHLGGSCFPKSLNVVSWVLFLDLGFTFVNDFDMRLKMWFSYIKITHGNGIRNSCGERVLLVVVCNARIL